MVINLQKIYLCFFVLALIVEAQAQHSPSNLTPSMIVEKAQTSPEEFKTLVEAGQIDVNAQDERGRTALILASHSGNVEVVELLLKSPMIDINIQDEYGYIALIVASEYNHVEVVRLLLSNSTIDLNTHDKRGFTALIIASYIGHVEVVRLLLSYSGINVNAKKRNGSTALIVASKNNHVEVVRLLLSDSRIDEYSKNIYTMNTAGLMTTYGYIKSPEEFQNYVIQVRSDLRSNNGQNSLIDRPSKVLLVDDRISEINHLNLGAQALQISEESKLNPLYDGYQYLYSTHGNMTLQALMTGGSNGMNFFDVYNHPNLDCFTNELSSVLLAQVIEEQTPDVVNISCGTSKPTLRKTITFIESLIDIAHSSKTIVVNSAGNYEYSLPLFTTDYLFLIASVDAKGLLSHVDLHIGSNFGEGVDFAAPSFNVFTANISTPEHFDKTFLGWGGTSYAAPLVSGLIARMLNYLPQGARYFPKFIKSLIIKNGDFSEHLVGKLKHPIVINSGKTLSYMRNNLFFKYKIEEGRMFLQCDKRLMYFKKTGDSKNIDCSVKDTGSKSWSKSWTEIDSNIDKLELDVVYAPFYSSFPEAKCSFNLKGLNSNELFPGSEGILTCH